MRLRAEVVKGWACLAGSLAVASLVAAGCSSASDDDSVADRGGSGGTAGGGQNGSGGAGAAGVPGTSGTGAENTAGGGGAGNPTSNGGGGASGAGTAAGEGGTGDEPIEALRLCRTLSDAGPCEPPRLDLEDGRSCALDDGGRVHCWGANGYNPPGDGFYAACAGADGAFVRVGLGDGGCALDVSGHATCWGGDWDAWSPPPPEDEFDAFEVVSKGGCGLDRGGRLECFGRWTLADSGYQSPDYESPFSAVSVHEGLLCVLDGEGGVTCWGAIDNPATRAPSDHFVALSAGADHACGILSSGAVECWGNDAGGKATPPSGTFVQIAAGYEHTCGLRSDGTLACWGDPALTGHPDGHFLEVKVALTHSCARRPNGTITCWGDDSELELGVPAALAAPSERFARLEVGGQLWLEEAGGGLDDERGWPSACGVRLDGHLACWGALANVPLPEGKVTDLSAGSGVACVVGEDDSLTCVRASSAPGLPEPPSGLFRQVAVGFAHACAVRTDGSIACWQATAGVKVASLGPPPSGTFTQVAVSSLQEPPVGDPRTDQERSACALRDDGDVTCWGAGAATTDIAGPFVEISATCGLRADGSVTCWSGPLEGEVEGTYTSVRGGWPVGKAGPAPGLPLTPPAGVSLDTYQTLARARDFACGLDASGFVHCMGNAVR